MLKGYVTKGAGVVAVLVGIIKFLGLLFGADVSALGGTEDAWAYLLSGGVAFGAARKLEIIEKAAEAINAEAKNPTTP